MRPAGSTENRAWRIHRADDLTQRRFELGTEGVPEPGDDELLLRVLACGVCRTDLHLLAGDLAPHRDDVVPGHEVIGEVVALGATVSGFEPGERVGVAWLRGTCGTCVYCRRGTENLCPDSTYTGWDHDGGYADFVTAPAAYAHRLPAGYSDVELAPLLCAGIIGYRALRRATVPDGGRLGLYGFGASAHLTAQVALAQGAEVYVMTRDAAARQLAVELGATWVGGAKESPPVPLDSAILFAPAGELVPPALAALDRGGTLAVAGIHLTDIPPLNYHRHLFQERQLRSVTANTREDARNFLTFAGQHRLRVATSTYPLELADAALTDLAADRVHGAAVLLPGSRDDPTNVQPPLVGT